MFRKSTKKWVITFIILDIFAIICLITFYVPFFGIRDFLITNAMPTMSHKYIARTFYSNKTIKEVLNSNKVIELEDSTDPTKIDFTKLVDTGHYSSIYEEQVLKRDKGNDLYKIITVEEDGYKAYIAVIYDAKRVHLVSSSNSGKQKIDEIAEENNAKIAINASGYTYGKNYTKIPSGAVIIDGKIASNVGKPYYGGGIVGFNEDGVLMLINDTATVAIKAGMVQGMEFGPFLIVNGKMANIKGDGGWGKAQRTAIAQRKDGIVLFLVSDGRQYNKGIIGMSMKQIATLLLKYGAYNASNLDGGNSAIMYANGKYISTPSTQEGDGGRHLPNAWIVK
ncbi:MAG: phosphodiester glycosidase family protein [Tenericutes bacterium]|nr:phosphodiester glycosidase family protein [Mycoplasmatota bacterium]